MKNSNKKRENFNKSPWECYLNLSHSQEIAENTQHRVEEEVKEQKRFLDLRQVPKEQQIS